MEKVLYETTNESIVDDLDLELDEQGSLNQETLLLGTNLPLEKEDFELPEGIRLDLGVTDVLGKSRSFVQGLITQECILLMVYPKKLIIRCV